MPDQAAIQRGRDFEQSLANQISGSLQPGSGNKFFAKGDVTGNGFLISAKSEINYTWSRINKYLSEAIEMAYQTGNIPVLALDGIEKEDEDLVVMRLTDFVKAFENEVKIPQVSESKGIQKRKEIETPLMLR